jgi:neutral ceramidase
VTSSGALHAGAATVDITPESLVGLNAMGADFTGVRDALYAKALVLGLEGSQFAIVSADLLELGSTVQLRERIELELGIPAHAVLLSASHSHNAPRAGRTPSGGLSRAASAESLAYSDWLFDRLVEVVDSAQRSLRPATLGFGTGAVDVNVNRDVFVDGKWVLGQNPVGPSDKTLGVIAVKDAEGLAIATLIDYAVHPTASLGTRVLSADVAGATTSAIEEKLGGVALWLPGAIGDQAIRDSLESRARSGRAVGNDAVFFAVEEQGRLIADEALRVAQRIVRWRQDPELSAQERTVSWPAKRGTDLPPDMHQDELDEVSLRVIAFVIGDLVLAGVGGEVTTAAAARILEACRNVTGSSAFLVSIANERIGYLADEDAFALGTFAARGCPVVVGWERAVAATFSELLSTARVAS